MQQYRVNYTLLVGLMVGTLVTSGVVYGLWKFQIERKSGVLLNEAEKARAEGDNRNAVQYYSHYLSIHGSDDDTRIKLAESYADLIQQEDVEPEEFGSGVRVLEMTVRELPEALGVRRSLVDLYGRMSRFQDALDHLNYMLLKEPEDAELLGLRASYLVNSGDLTKAADLSYELIGYDAETDTFDEKKAKAPKDVDVYTRLANILRKDGKPELADRVMDQMIEVNPDSAAAYLSRGGYWIAWEQPEKGQEDIDKAYQLAPEDANVLLVMAGQASNDKEIEDARELLTKGKKLHPDDPRFYQASADLEAKQQKYKEALAEIDAGLKAVGVQKGGVLLIFKADLQFHNEDLQGVRETIREMKDAGFRPEYLEWYEARILLAEGKWFPAAEALSRLRSRATNLGDLSIQIDNFLGLAYERMGRLELAQRSYKDVVQQDPENAPALAGLQRVESMIGIEPKDGEVNPLQKELEKILAQPKDQRDWDSLDELVDEFAKERKMDEVQLKLFQVNLAVMREDFAGAKKLLKEADKLKPDNLQIYRALIQVTRLDPKEGPAKAMELWKRVSQKFGDVPALRLDRADLLIAINDEQLRPQLASLISGIDDWTVDQKVELWGGMAARYLNLGMVEEAKQYLTLVADNRPDELPARLSLFTLALETNDDQGMKDAQKKILDIVGDINDSQYLYTEARRQLSELRRGRIGPEAIPEIRVLIDRAVKQRPDWHELYLVRGDLELHANNPQLALEHYDKAEKLGRPNPRAVAQHIRLLVAFGQYRQAGELLDRVPEQSRQLLLGQLYTEILFRTNKVADAVEEARTAAETDPENAQKQFWYGQLLARSSLVPDLSDADRKKTMTQAIAALRKAVELEAELPDAWYALITLNMQQENPEAAQQALRDAQLSLSGDNLQLFLAKSYEALGRWFDAETMYRAVYEVDPKDVRRAQQLAAFYLSPIYRQPDKQAKLTPLLNQILRAADEVDADGKKVLAANDPNLLWARRVGAEILAGTRDYQKLIKAENMLASSAQGGILPIEERLQMAQILAPRPEPESRLKAARLLEEVSAEQPLNEMAEITLGQLYFAMGDWEKCRTQMQETIGRFRKSIPARESYIRMLLSRNEPQYDQAATTQLNALRELAPNGRGTFALTVQLAGRLGRQKEVRAELLRRLPKIADASKLTTEQAQMLAFFAGLLIELDDLDSAEKIYRQLVVYDPKQVFALASFLGTHRDVGKCFEQLQEAYNKDTVQEVLTVGVNVLRDQRDKVGDKYDAQMEGWLDRGLRDNPDSISLQMLQADFYDVQRKYEDAMNIYTKLLKRPDLTGIRRAIVLNNLSFLVALAGTGDSGSDLDPMKLVEEAESILGPSADILDTKAVVLIEREQYKDAIEELRLSVTDNPTGAKYFHMVVAHLAAGEKGAALEAWDKAEAAGLKRDVLNRLEHARYDKVKAQIDQLRAGTASISRS